MEDLTKRKAHMVAFRLVSAATSSLTKHFQSSSSAAFGIYALYPVLFRCSSCFPLAAAALHLHCLYIPCFFSAVLVANFVGYCCCMYHSEGQAAAVEVVVDDE